MFNGKNLALSAFTKSQKHAGKVQKDQLSSDFWQEFKGEFCTY